MKYLIIILVVLCFCPKSDRSIAASDFVPGINGLPLIPGFAVIPQTQVVFNTPAGRIVEVSLSGELSPSKVLSFYQETLPQLGWSPVSKYKFIREGEILKLVMVEYRNKIMHIRFSIRTNYK